MDGNTTLDTDTTRVLVVDDHRTLADAISLALAGQPDLTCVGVARDTETAISLASATRPDVVVMDLRLGQGDGLKATERILALAPETRVVVLTAFITPGLLLRVAEAGAVALLPKDGGLEDLLSAIRTSGHGRFFAHPDVVRSMAGPLSEAERSRNLLTPRELEVLELLAQGSDARMTARALGISVQTCRGYIKNILFKMHTHTQLEAVVSALRQGLVRLDA